MGLRGTWEKAEDGGGGGDRMQDGRHRLAQGTRCGRPEREGITDKRWGPAGGGAIQVDGRSAYRQVGGEK